MQNVLVKYKPQTQTSVPNNHNSTDWSKALYILPVLLLAHNIVLNHIFRPMLSVDATELHKTCCLLCTGLPLFYALITQLLCTKKTFQSSLSSSYRISGVGNSRLWRSPEASILGFFIQWTLTGLYHTLLEKTFSTGSLWEDYCCIQNHILLFLILQYPSMA